MVDKTWITRFPYRAHGIDATVPGTERSQWQARYHMMRITARHSQRYLQSVAMVHDTSPTHRPRSQARTKCIEQVGVSPVRQLAGPDVKGGIDRLESGDTAGLSQMTRQFESDDTTGFESDDTTGFEDSPTELVVMTSNRGSTLQTLPCALRVGPTLARTQEHQQEHHASTSAVPRLGTKVKVDFTTGSISTER